jgi:hypothetical protein
MFKLFSAAMLTMFFLVSQPFGQASFTDKGGLWLGSGFSFFSLGSEGSSSRENVFIASPFYRGFVAPHFALGINFNWFKVGDNSGSMSVFSPGVDLTFAGGKDKAVAYFTPGIKLNVYSMSASGYNGDSNTGTTISLNAGVIVQVGNIIGLQFEPGFDFITVEGHSSNMFHFSIGFCAVSDKVAISLLEKYPGL